MEYLVWYNTERGHRSIGKVAPLRYYVDKFIANPKQSNMHWTLTGRGMEIEDEGETMSEAAEEIKRLL